MIPVLNIDISEVIEATSMKKEDMQALSYSITEKVKVAFMNSWTSEVNKALHSTRDEYKKGMYVERLDETTVEVGLTSRQSQLAVDLEEGKNPFDQKEGFSKSSKAKRKVGGGWYITIPYRHATSEAVAESSVFSDKMPKVVEMLAKKKKEPLKKSDLPDPFNKTKTRERIDKSGTSFGAYEHKHPIHEGLGRKGSANHGHYMTFRRVSDNSDPMSWVHPGFAAKDLMEKAFNKLDIGSIIAIAKDEYLGIL